MRRKGALFDSILDLDNIALGAYKAFRGKNDKREVIEFENNFDANIVRVKKLIQKGEIECKYHRFIIYEPKERQIYAASLVDRIIQHSIMNVCHNYFERTFIFDSYASRIGKGIDAAIIRTQKGTIKFRYFAKLDVRKYFDSINHEVLKSILLRMFKDQRLLGLFWRIIDSYCVKNGCGIPIGNLMSQYFANAYLNRIDHFMKEDVKVPFYVRYMDDVVMMDDDLYKLKNCIGRYVNYAREILKLEIKPPVIGTTKEGGVCFLGYKIKSGSVTLCGRSKRRYRHKLLLIDNLFITGKISELEYRERIQSMIAFAKRATSEKFMKSCLSLIYG